MTILTGCGAKTAILGALLFGAAGCATSDPTPDNMVRPAVETAPADLQLLCASAVQQATGTSRETLPASSQRVSANAYQVNFEVGGTVMACTVDTAGNVLSVQPAAT